MKTEDECTKSIYSSSGKVQFVMGFHYRERIFDKFIFRCVFFSYFNCSSSLTPPFETSLNFFFNHLNLIEMDKTNSRILIPLTLKIEILTGEQQQTIIAAEAVAPAATASAATGLVASEAEMLINAKNVLSNRKEKDVVDVRLGYKFENGWITKKRAIVVVVKERKSRAALEKENITAIPDQLGGYPVDITTPTIEELLAARADLKRANPVVEREGRYFPPANVQLEKVTNERMRLIACVSPEHGWTQLKSFLEPTQKSLTIAMYDFGAKHIIDTINTLAGKNGFESYKLTLQPGESVGTGTKKDDLTDEDTAQSFSNAFGRNFQMAWVHIGSVNGWVNSSYHIKVAVKDSQAIHLSSGNYQSSNQPDVDSLPDNSAEFLLKTYNREWHALIEHPRIAQMYEGFIQHDMTNNKDGREAMVNNQDLYLLVPKFIEVEAEAPKPKRKFDPFDQNRNFTVTPLLTPDNYFDEVLTLVKRAEDELYIQNQTFNCPGDNHDKLRELVNAVLERQEAGVDVKIIFRAMFPANARKNLEGLIDLGFDPKCFKVHDKVHTKGIIVDKKFVLIGSQNWSNDGVSVNRDASLLFEDKPLAEYFREIFLHDWFNVAKTMIGREGGSGRIVGREAEVPGNMVKIPLGDILEAS